MQANPSQDLQSAHKAADAIPANAASQNGSAPINGRHQPEKRAVKKSNQICRFYGTKKGCRAQDQCPYLHVQTAGTSAVLDSPVQGDVGSTTGDASVNADGQLVRRVPLPQHRLEPRDRAAVPKPTSSLQQKDPREYQIGQVVRRFNPDRLETPDGTILRLKLQPSDPDFPFDLDFLECTLTVPIAYPQSGKPSIQVENKDIPKGFQINIERGFDSLCSGSPSRTLLQLANDLDRNLERFLTAEKAQTVKIVANRRIETPTKTASPIAKLADGTPSVAHTPKAPPPPSWTTEQKKNAKAKRESDIRQLEARMGKVLLFSSSKDGISFNVPLQIPKPARLPLALKPLKETTLIVPVLYDLEPCRICLKGVVGPEVENVEIAFEQRVRGHQEMSLMAHINYLTQNIHNMALTSTAKAANVPPTTLPASEPATQAAIESQETLTDIYGGVADEERPHLRFLSHPPPEWSRNREENEDSESESTDEYESEGVSSDASEDAPSVAGGATVPISAPASNLEKGVLLSFPHLELHGVELLELRDLSLSIKCDRCKETMDIKDIKPADPTINSIRTESCNKCASPMSVSYRSEPMHANSVKAGHLDLEGCTVVDMLPSRFVPTCSECSTTQPAPGIVAVRGEAPLAVCRECHRRLNFKIPEVKFLRVSANDPRLNLPLRPKRKRENLGITAGTELPNRGRCKHYTKSYRWFRFSCCNRVYPCDRCHDEKEKHATEHANRMICGWCSREQNYRPEDCNACGRSVIRKTGGGFWEGGKGTRDRVKMSRKDPRKHKRVGGGAAAEASSKK